MIAGYLMTGGKNRRMDGKKKLFLELDGKSFLESILDALRGFDKIYLSVEEEAPYEHLNLPMVVDEIPDIGPIGGIYSGLKNCEADALFVVACDMPFVTKTAVRRLFEVYSHRHKITIAWADDMEHPLLGIYPKSALPHLEEQIMAGDYKLMHALVHAGYTVVTLPKEDSSARNINTVAEYEQLLNEN